MKILFDYQAFMMQNFGGVSKCFAELIYNLPPEVKYKIGIKESDNIYLHELKLVQGLKNLHWTKEHFLFPFYIKGQEKLLGFFNKTGLLQTPYVINRNYTIDLLNKKEYDVFHPTFFDDYFLPYLGEKPFVLTIHDMIPELFFSKNNFQTQKKKILAKKASHIIAVSENTKNDIIKILDIPEEKISVIYHAYDNNTPQKENVILPDKFILYIGMRAAYKAFEEYLIKVSPFFNKHKDIFLLCTGKPFTAKERALINKLNLTDQVKIALFSTPQLMYVYSKAIAFVYPSKYEGFGIPILEAFASECPTLLNQASCFPEIAQDAAIYFDINDEASCIQALETVSSLTPEEKNNLIQKGKKRLSDFSWEKSALQLTEVYKKII